MGDMIQDNTVFNGDKPDETDALRDQNGRFRPGRRLGRPAGSLCETTKLKDRLLRTVKLLDEDPKYKGDFLLWFGREYPEKFLSLIASLLPKKLTIEQDHMHVHVPVMSLPEVERARIFEDCRRRIVEIRGVKLIESADVKVLDGRKLR